MKGPAATQCSYGKRICFPALRSQNGLAKRFSKLRGIRLCNWRNRFGCLTNRFIGNKQQYFLRRALQVTVHRGAKRNHSSAESFLGSEFIQMFRNICYCNAICAIRVRVYIPSMKPPRQRRSMRRKLLLKDGAAAVHCKM